MNKEKLNHSFPPTAEAATSPQGGNGFLSQFLPLLGGDVNKVDRGGYKKYTHSKKSTEKSFNNAKQLRKNTTEAEKLLWYYIKNKQVKNYKFRRQAAIGNYIVDFLCPKRKLIIELDGGQHNDNIKYDENRTKYLNTLGYKVLRFWDNDVFKNMNDILETIYRELNDE